MVLRLTDRVADLISETFRVSGSEAGGEDGVFLTKPLFLSSIDGSKKRNGSSAGYSFFHVDRDTKEHFHYSALLYLDDGSGQDFAGGELVFAGRRRRPQSRPLTVSPRAGKLASCLLGVLDLAHHGSCLIYKLTPATVRLMTDKIISFRTSW